MNVLHQHGRHEPAPIRETQGPDRRKGRPMLHWLCDAVILFTIMSSVACGYHFRSSGEPLGIRMESLAIPMVRSSSSDIGLESHFTRVLREAFISNSRVPILPEGEAEFLLVGRIYEITTVPIAYDQEESIVSGHKSTYSVTGRRRLMLKFDAKLVERASGRIIWRENAMAERADFDVGIDPLETRYNRSQALEEIAGLLSKRVFLMTLERF